MTDTIQFFVEGDPKPQPRLRAFSINGTARVYDPHTAEGWKSAIADAARPHCPPEPWRGAVGVMLLFNFKRPKSHYRTGKRAGELREDVPDWHTKKPDGDNLVKAVLDAMTLLGFWVDDSQVCSLEVDKVYMDVAGPGVSVRVSNLTRQPIPA